MSDPLNPRRILAFDTALSGCAAALADLDADACTGESLPMLRGQAEALMPMVVRVMDKAGVSFDQIDLIVTTVGPGAFTGLRLGLSAGRALGLALVRPVVGLTTFEVLAAAFRTDHPGCEGLLVVVLETKRQDFYYQILDAATGREITPPAAAEAGDVAAAIRREAETMQPRVTLIGDAPDRFAAVCADAGAWDEAWDRQGGYELTDPCVMARLAADTAVHRAPEPLYLRGADVSQPKRKAREIVG